MTRDRRDALEYAVKIVGRYADELEENERQLRAKQMTSLADNVRRSWNVAMAHGGELRRMLDEETS